MADANIEVGQPQKPLNETFSSLPTTIFEVMTRLSMQHDSINLGQGFPDDEAGTEAMKRKAGDALLEFPNQYAPLLGLPELRQAVAAFAEAAHPGIPVDPATESLITLGATEALASAMLALLNPGDEAILLDPCYDAYGPMCRRAGGVPKFVPLDPETWDVRREALAAAFSSKTKLLLLNSPHNPTGKVFSRSDLDFIAQLCVQHDVYVISDEVYEHLVFAGHKHVTIRSLPGMADRTIRIGSAGKTFSLTAWKVGWVTGPARLVGAIAKAHQFVTFCIPSNLQRGVAYGLQHEQRFYKGLGQSLQGHREFLQRQLEEIGFRVLPGQGTYFLVADIQPLAGRGRSAQDGRHSSSVHENVGSGCGGGGGGSDSGDETDVKFCQRLTVEAGVTLIPVSAFYSSPDPPRHLVRFCFCKSMDKLRGAAVRLQAYFAS